MLNSNELINLIKEYNPKCNEDLIGRAYDYGKNYHEGQFRASGEEYFNFLQWQKNMARGGPNGALAISIVFVSLLS